MSWLDRLPPEYRRRYYTNLAFIGGLILFFAVVGRLDKRSGTIAILGLFGLLIAFTFVWPLVRLLMARPRPRPSAYVFYGAWIAAYAYFGAGTVLPLPGAGLALLLGLVLMLAFFAMYRKVIFPDAFDGGIAKRFAAVRAAQRAERAERAAFIESIRMRSDKSK